MPQSDECADNRIFIAEWQDEYVGLLVDAVSDVVAVDLNTLSPSPANIGAVQGRYFKGVCHPEFELVAILGPGCGPFDGGELGRPMKLKTLVVDDSVLYRRIISDALAQIPEVEVLERPATARSRWIA